MMSSSSLLPANVSMCDTEGPRSRECRRGTSLRSLREGRRCLDGRDPRPASQRTCPCWLAGLGSGRRFLSAREYSVTAARSRNAASVTMSFAVVGEVLAPPRESDGRLPDTHRMCIVRHAVRLQQGHHPRTQGGRRRSRSEGATFSSSTRQSRAASPCLTRKRIFRQEPWLRFAGRPASEVCNGAVHWRSSKDWSIRLRRRVP